MRLIHKLQLSFTYKYFAYLTHRITVYICPHWEINRYFMKIFKRKINLQTPKSLIEKIYWMQLHTDTSMWSLCADKYRMREFVDGLHLSNYLPKLLGHWNNYLDIDFNSLPNSFVLKTNNGCETVLIIKDKENTDITAIYREIKNWLRIPYGYSGYEPHYLNISPCFIAEELLIQDQELSLISPKSLIDYKIWCINGEPRSILVAYNRTHGSLNMSLYDTNWNDLSKYLISNNHTVYNSEIKIPCPSCLDEMLMIARKLTAKFSECRVDFYNIKGKPILGELTFSSGYGYFTEEYYNFLGEDINLDALEIIR